MEFRALSVGLTLAVGLLALAVTAPLAAATGECGDTAVDHDGCTGIVECAAYEGQVAYRVVVFSDSVWCFYVRECENGPGIATPIHHDCQIDLVFRLYECVVEDGRLPPC